MRGVFTWLLVHPGHQLEDAIVWFGGGLDGGSAPGSWARRVSPDRGRHHRAADRDRVEALGS
jgi:hypothetical protein